MISSTPRTCLHWLKSLGGSLIVGVLQRPSFRTRVQLPGRIFGCLAELCVLLRLNSLNLQRKRFLYQICRQNSKQNSNSATWLNFRLSGRILCSVEVELPVTCREKDFYIRSTDRIQSRTVIDIVDIENYTIPINNAKNLMCRFEWQVYQSFSSNIVVSRVSFTRGLLL